MATIANLVVEIKGKADSLNRALSSSSRNVSNFASKTGTQLEGAFKKGLRGTQALLKGIRSVTRGLARMARQGLSAINRMRQGFTRFAGILTGVVLVSVGLLLREIIQVANEIDVVAKNARALNIGVKTFQELSYAANIAGVNNEKLSATLRFMNRTIGETAMGIGAAGEAFKELGLSAEELSDLSLDQQFDRIAERLRGVDNASQRAALAAKFFGAEGIFAVNKMIDGLGMAREEFRGLGVTLSSEQTLAVEAFNDARTALLAIWTGFKQQVVITLQ